jgi:hypothetical protein
MRLFFVDWNGQGTLEVSTLVQTVSIATTEVPKIDLEFGELGQIRHGTSIETPPLKVHRTGVPYQSTDSALL